MKKKFSIFSLVLMFCLNVFNFHPVCAEPSNNRLAGKSRYETSLSIASNGWKQSDYVILANGNTFADALSSAPLAKKYNAPIILTETNKLNDNIIEKLKDLKVKKVFLIGGTGVISTNIEKQLKNLKINFERIYGKSRFDTSLEIAKKIGLKNGFIITNGYGFADALSVAPVAAKKQMPIILSPSNNLPYNTKKFIDNNAYGKVYILGGNTIVSNNIQNSLKNTERLFGKNRFDTNAVILNKFRNDLNLSNVYVSSGINYPDALSVSSLVSKNNGVLILSDGNDINDNLMSFIKDNYDKILKVTAVGGNAIISDIIVKSIIMGKQIDNLKISYINVGQGDSILIQQDGHNMLIDAGTNEASNTVVNYLKSKGINKLDYVIATHPHEDHIGGMCGVINNFYIDKFIMPKATHTSQTFENMINSLKNKNIKITNPNVGDNYGLGYANFTILAPNNSNYDNLNNYSVVTKLKFGNNSFIFTGDAEALSEGEILAKQLDISADVLKLGHHGSRTSTTYAFLNKVSPKYAIVSCGKNNKYGHPNKSVMDILKSKNIKVYRTDENGNIIATSDGKDIKFNCSPASYKANDISNTKPIHKSINKVNKAKPTPAKPIQQTVYIAGKGRSFHKANCVCLKRSKYTISISRSKAISQGYKPCKVCNP